MISSQIVIITVTKEKNIFQKKYHKRKRTCQKSYNTSSIETKDEELYIPKRKIIKKGKQKEVDYDDVDDDTNDDYPYYEPSSPTDDDVDDDSDNNDSEKK